MKKNNLKKYYKRFKELWSVPRYRAIIKLSLYGIMFLLIIIMANIYQGTNEHTQPNEEEQTKTYTEIINSIDLENCDIKYLLKTSVNEYKLEGKIENNNITGYIENNNIIKKIIIKDNNIYQIINEAENLDTELTTNLLPSLLLPKNIIELVNTESAYIEKNETTTSYTYTINYNNNEYEIKLTANKETLTNITIKNNVIEYNMEVNFDKK